MDEPKKAKPKAPAKAKVFRKNYYLKGFGCVGKGSVVTAEHKKLKDFKDSLTE